MNKEKILREFMNEVWNNKGFDKVIKYVHNEYTIHVDVEWEDPKNYDKAIHQALKNVSSLAILGEYVRGKVKIQNQ